ncbi:hypothetical protein SKAU_G00079880 [Synaphobranchus kaupii]|uniref:Uncharacterized protein n=1 Tax=Synaphobranchus kaupii TaxID=118154 RepID=A0A9Q1FVF6_SYNKA|nr:hypothetical protein SKAU_G00079880 [Synaphobranchus kaupii]
MAAHPAHCHPSTSLLAQGVEEVESSTVEQTSGQQPACEASSEENLQDRAGMEEVPGSLMAEERVTENERES